MQEEDADSTVGSKLPVVPQSVIAKALEPAASEFGEAIRPAGKDLGVAVLAIVGTIKLALSPLRLMVWGYDRVSQ